ncbi:T9SS type A sorting domain-containing protein [bacterium]|nr:T9SS type A sorting domain-containing protein [bacterium]MBU1982877.1 T9SS type A sorting domain-containing protein [bacterium]
MENWERRFDRMHTPDSSVPSHREALRKQLQSDNIPPRCGGRTVVTMVMMAVVMFGGLTLAYPSWAKDLWHTVLVHTITFRTQDGHTVVIKKFPAEACCPAGSDTSCQMMFVESGERRAISFEADIEKFSMTGEGEQTITISTPDCDKIWIVNGDTVKAENMLLSAEEFTDEPGTFNWTGKEDVASEEDQELSLGQTPELSANFELGQNYPNPFNPTTQISFDLKQSGPVTLKVYNLMGQEIATLLDGYSEVGNHRVSFNGSGLPSGTYLYSLKAGDFQVTRQMILMK